MKPRQRKIKPRVTREQLEDLYGRFNRREYVSPDPLQFLYDYPDLKDREVVGLLSATFAYGNVKQILKTVGLILQKMDSSPHEFLMGTADVTLKKSFIGFQHRWHRAGDLTSLLIAMRQVVKEYGSLQGCFLKGYDSSHENILPALSSFIDQLTLHALGAKKNLLPSPSRGSACKRLHMFLRWMVRHDAVDPGGWDKVSPSKLIVPIDTHMHRLGKKMGLTRRNQADQRTALEITESFRSINTEDPVRYDFVITRMGINKDPIFKIVKEEFL